LIVNLISEYYMAMYPYDSAEPGDLTFGQGEMILVTKKDGEWWTGSINGQRTGLFPASYASKVEGQEVCTFNKKITFGTASSKILVKKLKVIFSFKKLFWQKSCSVCYHQQYKLLVFVCV